MSQIVSATALLKFEKICNTAETIAAFLRRLEVRPMWMLERIRTGEFCFFDTDIVLCVYAKPTNECATYTFKEKNWEDLMRAIEVAIYREAGLTQGFLSLVLPNNKTDFDEERKWC